MQIIAVTSRLQHPPSFINHLVSKHDLFFKLVNLSILKLDNDILLLIFSV